MEKMLTASYILLIPLNLFGLALPTTTLLTLLPPAFLALGVLEQPSSNNDANEAASRALLAYFVTLGFIQFLESAAAGLLERRIRKSSSLFYHVWIATDVQLNTTPSSSSLWPTCSTLARKEPSTSTTTSTVPFSPEPKLLHLHTLLPRAPAPKRDTTFRHLPPTLLPRELPLTRPKPAATTRSSTRLRRLSVSRSSQSASTARVTSPRTRRKLRPLSSTRCTRRRSVNS